MPTSIYLSINGNNVDSYALIGSVRCTHGRTDITSQPAPSTFNCTLQIPYGTMLEYPIDIDSRIIWQIYDSSAPGSNTPIFYGSVSDVSVNLEWLNGNGFLVYSITGVDELAKLNNKSTANGFAKAYEGNRLVTLLAGYSYDTTYITSPGDYEIASITSGTVNNVLSMCQDAAQSAMGTLYCDPKLSGKFVYTTYLDRKSNPLITLSTADVLAADFTVSTSTNLVVNQTNVTYKNGLTSTTYNDTTSQAIYGIRSGTRDTSLHNLTDANTQAQTLLASRKAPSFSLRSITINTATISDALRTSLVNAGIGTRISISGLPTDQLQSMDGYIEGYTWTTQRGQDIIQMNISNAAELYPYTLWNELNGTDTWNTYATATTTWSNIN